MFDDRCPAAWCATPTGRVSTVVFPNGSTASCSGEHPLTPVLALVALEAWLAREKAPEGL
jgi:hypothetical protein